MERILKKFNFDKEDRGQMNGFYSSTLDPISFSISFKWSLLELCSHSYQMTSNFNTESRTFIYFLIQKELPSNYSSLRFVEKSTILKWDKLHCLILKGKHLPSGEGSKVVTIEMQ